MRALKSRGWGTGPPVHVCSRHTVEIRLPHKDSHPRQTHKPLGTCRQKHAHAKTRRTPRRHTEQTLNTRDHTTSNRAHRTLYLVRALLLSLSDWAHATRAPNLLPLQHPSHNITSHT